MQSKPQLSTTCVKALDVLPAAPALAQAAEPAEKAADPLEPGSDSEIQEPAYTSPVWYTPAKG